MGSEKSPQRAIFDIFLSSQRKLTKLKSMNSLRFFWLAIFALLIGIASYLAEELFFPIRLFPQGSLEAQIHEDFRRLKDQKALPNDFSKIHEVFIRDQRLQKSEIDWKTLSAKDFPQDPNGHFDLQIEIFDAEESSKNSKETSEIVQFSLFEKDSKNKIWELNRDYFLPSQAEDKK